jgi:hypothetical protein
MAMSEDDKVFDRTDVDATDVLRKRAREVCRRLVWRAEKVFAPPGARLSIDEHEIHDKFTVAFDRPRHNFHDEERPDFDAEDKAIIAALAKFDPLAVWKWLEKRYGGKKGKDLGYTQTAETLVRELNLQAGNQIKTMGGRVILNKRVYGAAVGGKRCIGFSDESPSQTMMALAAVAGWTDNIGAAHDLNRIAQHLRPGADITSRERFVAEDCLEVITYNSRIELRLEPAFAGKLQEFISTYSAGG